MGQIFLSRFNPKKRPGKLGFDSLWGIARGEFFGKRRPWVWENLVGPGANHTGRLDYLENPFGKRLGPRNLGPANSGFGGSPLFLRGKPGEIPPRRFGSRGGTHTVGEERSQKGGETPARGRSPRGKNGV